MCSGSYSLVKTLIIANLEQTELTDLIRAIAYTGAAGSVKGYELHGPYVATYLDELPKALQTLGWKAVEFEMNDYQIVIRNAKRQEHTPSDSNKHITTVADIHLWEVTLSYIAPNDGPNAGAVSTKDFWIRTRTRNVSDVHDAIRHVAKHEQVPYDLIDMIRYRGTLDN